MSSEETKAITEVIPLKELTLRSSLGNLVFSIKNSFIKITFFFTEKNQGILSGSMNINTFSVLAGFVESIVASKEDKKYELLCFGNDYNTKEKVLQSVIVVARRGDELYMGIKKTRENSAVLSKLELNEWNKIYSKGIEVTSSRVINNEAALGYAAQMRYVISKYANIQPEGGTVPPLNTLRELNIWSNTGNLTASVKNGYPRFTFFNKDKTKGMVSAPMNMNTFGIVSGLLYTVANSKEELEYELLCYNNDHKTKERILQSVLVMHRKGDNVYFGIRRTRESNEELPLFEISNWNKIFVDNDEQNALHDTITAVVVGYVGQMKYIVSRYTGKDELNEMPNSERTSIDVQDGLDEL